MKKNQKKKTTKTYKTKSKRKRTIQKKKKDMQQIKGANKPLTQSCQWFSARQTSLIKPETRGQPDQNKKKK